jgi:arylsulfatase A-like enzyme/tetratricopeptide (TPR) repeat protein
MTNFSRAANEHRLTRTIRQGRPWLAASLAALLLTGCGKEPKPWNVVLVTFDTTRADRIGAYGNDRIETPILDGLAADGILFSQAVSVAPITAPSHSSILTGLYPTAHGFRDNGLFVLEDHQITLAEMLREQGYATAAAVGAFPVVSQFGFDQGFDLFDDHLTGMYEDYLGERAVPKEQLFFDERRAAQVNEAVLPWLEQRGDQPFFLWLHYFDPHQPFEPPPPYDQLYADDLYNGEIAYTDSRLGHLLAQLERLGQLDRTLIVMTADHGEGLGEHNELTHAMLAYDSTLHVPLIIRPPSGAAPAGRVIEDRVGVVDIVPTVLDLLGLPLPEHLHGGSLQPLWSTDEASSRYTPRYYAENLSPRLTHGWGELRVLYDGPLKYIHGPRPELYDLTVDPKELDDLLARKPEDAARMREALAGFIQDHAADQPVETRALDPELVRRLQSLGYLHGSGEGGEQIREVLIDDGVPPQDRVTDLNRMSAAKHLLFDGRPSDALNYTEKLVATGGGSPMYLELHAAALAGVGRIDEAWDAARLLMEQRNVSDQLAVYLASRQFEGGRQQEAIQFLGELADRQPAPRTLWVLASMHREIGDVPTALDRLDQAIEVQDDFAPARVDRAVLFARSGDAARAEAEFLAALDSNPYYPKAQFNYGAFLVENGRLDEAIPLFDRAVALAPTYLNARAAQVTAHALAGDLDAARAALQPLERMAPDAAEVVELRRWVESL